MEKILFSKKMYVITASAIMLSGCAMSNFLNGKSYSDMQSIALCQVSEQATQTEGKIIAEYGFRRFAKNTYRPVLDSQLFGHAVIIIELNSTQNKLYVAGTPQELGHQFKTLLKDITCEKNNCQAPIGNGQTLYIYRPKIKKSKNTTIIECAKPEQASE